MCKSYPRWQILGSLALCILVSAPSLTNLVVAADSGSAQPGAIAQAPTAPHYSAAALQVYRTKCLLCHDVDGRGELGRDGAPTIPNFTDARWQASRSDVELSRSILDGKGKAMPKMRDKLGSVDVKMMVALVRGFREGKLVVEEESEPAPTGEKAAGKTASGGRAPRLPADKNKVAQDGSRLFQRSCAMCHGRDGKGTDSRDSLPSIPDFTVLAWQQKRTNAQLVVSILDGKGAGMPAFRDKVPRERAREIVAYIRTFAPGATREVASSSNDFEARFNKLAQEFDDIARQIRALSAAAPTSAPAVEVSPK